MKKYFLISLVVAAASQICSAMNYKLTDFRNYFGLGWAEKADANEILTYCKNMGYKHVMYKHGMENSPLADGVSFYIESPEYGTYERTIDLRKKYPEDKIKMWESICAVAFPDKKFPENMATGWFFDENNVSLQLDMQQKAVHERTISSILGTVARIVGKNPNFKFGGFTWDVPQPYGDFNAKLTGKRLNNQVTLSHWLGVDSTPERDGISHDYKTYFEGYFEFYRSLMDAARELNPKAKFIVEPYGVYRDWVKYYESDFFKSKGKDAKKYMADFIWCEGNTSTFLHEENVYKDGLVKKSRTGSSSPHVLLEKDVRTVSADCAAEGAWATFFGRYGGYNNSPLAASIRDIPMYVKLGKAIPTWENLNNTPLEKRSFDGVVYSSPTAYMSPDVYWAIQPARDRIVAVFNTVKGEVKIPAGWRVKEVQFLDGIFADCGRADKKSILVDDGVVRLADLSLSVWGFAIYLEREG